MKKNHSLPPMQCAVVAFIACPEAQVLPFGPYPQFIVLVCLLCKLPRSSVIKNNQELLKTTVFNGSFFPYRNLTGQRKLFSFEELPVMQLNFAMHAQGFFDSCRSSTGLYTVVSM